MANTTLELPILLGAIYGGLLIGILYDVFKLLRLPFKNKWVVGILDVLYYILAGGLFAVTLLIINGGQLRIYAVLGVLAGVGIYLYFVSALIWDTVAHIRALFTKK